MSTDNSLNFLCFSVCINRVSVWQQVPVRDCSFYSQLQQEVPVCGGHIVLTGVGRARWTPSGGQRGGRQATTVQHCHSPLHRSPFSQLTASNLGVKAAFSLFLHPLVTLHSWMSHASLGSRERGPPSLHTDQRLLREAATHGQRALQRAPPRIGRTKRDMWHYPYTPATQVHSWKTVKSSSQGGIQDDVWGRNWKALMGNRVPLANNPSIWEVKMEV